MLGRLDDAKPLLEKAIEIYPDDTQAHLELGNLNLQSGNTVAATRIFRRALAIEPLSAGPPRALAIALMKADEFIEAESILRDAIRRVDQPKRWRLHLALSQVLARRAEKPGDPQFYEEALREANTALYLKEDPETYFHVGIVKTKVQDYEGALRAFEACSRLDEHNFEAARNATRLRSVILQQTSQARGGTYGAWLLGALAVLQLVALWVFYFVNRITETTVAVLGSGLTT